MNLERVQWRQRFWNENWRITTNNNKTLILSWADLAARSALQVVARELSVNKNNEIQKIPSNCCALKNVDFGFKSEKVSFLKLVSPRFWFVDARMARILSDFWPIFWWILHHFFVHIWWFETSLSKFHYECLFRCHVFRIWLNHEDVFPKCAKEDESGVRSHESWLRIEDNRRSEAELWLTRFWLLRFSDSSTMGYAPEKSGLVRWGYKVDCWGGGTSSTPRVFRNDGKG